MSETNKSNEVRGPFPAWVDGYNTDEVKAGAAREVILRVMHGPNDVPQERIPVSECGRLSLTFSGLVDEEVYPDGSVHPHLHRSA